MKAMILARLREPSTYAGLAALIGSASFIPYSTELASTVGAIGVAVTGLLAIWVPERK